MFKAKDKSTKNLKVSNGIWRIGFDRRAFGSVTHQRCIHYKNSLDFEKPCFHITLKICGLQN